MFSKSGNSHFPDTIKSSFLPNLEILGSPIGDFIYCSRFFLAEKCSLFNALLRALTDVSAVDLHRPLLPLSSLVCCLAFISSLAASDLGSPDNIQQAVSNFNAQVSPQDAQYM